MDKIQTFLSTQTHNKDTAISSLYSQFIDLYDRKLWHQLTLVLETLLSLPQSTPLLMPLYSNFIIHWEKKMNPLALVRFATRAAQLSKPIEAAEFLSTFVEKLKSSKDAFVMASMEKAHYQLQLNQPEQVKLAIDTCEKILEENPGLDSIIHASFYRVSADYFKLKMVYPQYYHNALLYLSSIPLDILSSAEKQSRAYELAISALLGQGLYNFGKLLMHPILDTLSSSPMAWLRTLLFQFNKGDLDGFEKTIKTKEFSSQPLLTAAIPFLRQKLCLMTLLEIVFKRSKESRGHMAFKDVANETRIPIDEVEHLVMKALSLGLVKGYIDQVDQAILITWVQPRILDKTQMATLRDRLSEWSSKVEAQTLDLDSQGYSDVFVQ